MRANIQFLWELEEEIGSPHFAAGLAAAVAGDAAPGARRCATDSVVVSDTIWIAAGQPSISYGLRGLMGFTVALETGAKDVHSGHHRRRSRATRSASSRRWSPSVTTRAPAR